MDKDSLDAVGVCGAQQGVEMLLVRMDTAVRQQADDMKLAIAFKSTLHGFGDLKGAADVWQKVLVVAPSSEEARAARQALDGLRSAHPDLNIPQPKGQGS